MKLNTDPNMDNPDDFYEMLIAFHRNLSDEESVKANAKLVLLLANHIGDREVIAEAMAIAAPKTETA